MIVVFIFVISPLKVMGANQFKIKDFNWNLSDVSSYNLSPEEIFNNMDRDFINVNSAICSNSAHMWTYDFHREYQLQSGKIFVFYTQKNSRDGLKNWWYHVAPIIYHQQELWVLDRGYPGLIQGPQSPSEWFHFFVKETACKEIKANEEEIIKLLFKKQVLPQETTYGKHDCYYKITPEFVWTPSNLAKTLLGKDENGRTINKLQGYNKSELYQACLEATTTKLTYSLPRSRARCRKFIR